MKKLKRRKSRYSRLQEAHQALIAKRELTGLTDEETEALDNIRVQLDYKERARFGHLRPSQSQEQLIRQAVQWNRTASLMTTVIALMREILEESLTEDGRLEGESLEEMLDALGGDDKEWMTPLLEWAGPEWARRHPPENGEPGEEVAQTAEAG